MFSFFRPKAKLGIVFHIGTASVGAGLLRMKKGESPHVVYSLRESIPYREDVNAERFVADMLDALKKLNSRLAKEGLAHLKFTEFGSLEIKHVYYVFSSPWTVTQTKVISIKEKSPFVLTRDQVDRAVSLQEKAFESEWDSEASHELNGLELLEKRVVDIRLNGYEVREPYGKKTSSADISLFVSLIPKTLFDKVIDISARTYHPKDTKASSFALASYSVIRDTFHEEGDFIFLDIGGELSDVTIVKNGLIMETASFPLGRHFLIRKIRKALQVSPEEAASLARLYEGGKADEDTIARVKPSMDEASKEWMAGLRSVLAKIGNGMTLPTKLFVVMNSDLVEFFMRTLSAERVSEFQVAEAPLSITLVSSEKLASSVSFGKHAEADPFIAIAASFVGKLYESRER